VYGIEIGEDAMAISEKYLRENKIYSSQISGQTIVFRWLADGTVAAIDPVSKKEILVTRAFWFAWYSFHTHTTLVI